MTDAINSSSIGPVVEPDDQVSSGQRSRKRDSLFLAARVSVGGGPATDIRVRNLSAGGLMIDNAPPMPIGTALVVELRAVGPVPGKVAWYTQGRAGIAFDAPIDPARMRKPVSARKR